MVRSISVSGLLYGVPGALLAIFLDATVAQVSFHTFIKRQRKLDDPPRSPWISGKIPLLDNPDCCTLDSPSHKVMLYLGASS